jgi:hypothetical protein
LSKYFSVDIAPDLIGWWGSETLASALYFILYSGGFLLFGKLDNLE